MNDNTYSSILVSTISKKIDLLDKLLLLTKQQEELIGNSKQLFEDIEPILDAKSKLIDSMNQLDSGFEQVFAHVKKGFQEKKDSYQDIILLLQERIKESTRKSAELQILEAKNYKGMQEYFAQSKREIQQFQQSNQAVTNYYKTAATQYKEQSFFLDKKK